MGWIVRYENTAKLKPYTYGSSAHIECPASTRPQEYNMIRGVFKGMFYINWIE